MIDQQTPPPATAAALPTPPPAPVDEAQLALAKRAQFLNLQYAVLFGASMLILVYNIFGGRTMATEIVWAACLGGAVITRVYRTSLVNKLNAQKGGPLI
jgi:hypothetical protein